jgi:hypothetical protein
MRVSRSGQGTIDAAFLLDWINKDPESYNGQTRESVRRVTDLMAAMVAAGAALRSFFVSLPAAGYAGTEPLPADLRKAMALVNSLLAPYKHEPVLDLRYLSTDPVDDATGLDNLLISYQLDCPRPQGEQWAIEQLIDLSRARKLSLLRKCDCGSWFLASRVDQTACSPQCRRRVYEQSEDYKAKRREYMRKNYHLKKQGIGVK